MLARQQKVEPTRAALFISGAALLGFVAFGVWKYFFAG